MEKEMVSFEGKVSVMPQIKLMYDFCGKYLLRFNLNYENGEILVILLDDNISTISEKLKKNQEVKVTGILQDYTFTDICNSPHHTYFLFAKRIETIENIVEIESDKEFSILLQELMSSMRKNKFLPIPLETYKDMVEKKGTYCIW